MKRMKKKIRVETYSGYKADERPKFYSLEDKSFCVKEIKERCLKEGAEGGREEIFVVTTECGKNHTILHNLIDDEWYLE